MHVLIFKHNIINTGQKIERRAAKKNDGTI